MKLLFAVYVALYFLGILVFNTKASPTLQQLLELVNNEAKGDHNGIAVAGPDTTIEEPMLFGNRLAGEANVFSRHIPHDDRFVPSFIVGGAPVNPPFSYPFMAAIMNRGWQFCGGSMIAPGWLLTAAHCTVGQVPGNFQILVHRHDLRKPASAEHGGTYSVSRFFVHPQYDPNSMHNDIALWKLTGYSGGADQNTFRVALDNGQFAPAGANSTVIGWGAIYQNGPASPVLLQVTLPIMNQQTCRSKLGSGIPDTVVCAGGQAGKDSCQGDSGGPLVYLRAGKAPVLIGVVSWGIGCAQAGYPGVYTRVSSFVGWIKSVVGSNVQLDVAHPSANEIEKMEEETIKELLKLVEESNVHSNAHAKDSHIFF